MNNPFGNRRCSCSLPHVVSEDRQTGPDRRTSRASCEHSTQPKLPFKHTDRRLDPTAKSLQLPKPHCPLMRLFCFAQPADLRNADLLNTGFGQLPHVLGSVIAAIGRQLGGLYAKTGFGVAQQRQQFGTIAGFPR